MLGMFGLGAETRVDRHFTFFYLENRNVATLTSVPFTSAHLI